MKATSNFKLALSRLSSKCVLSVQIILFKRKDHSAVGKDAIVANSKTPRPGGVTCVLLRSAKAALQIVEGELSITNQPTDRGELTSIRGLSVWDLVGKVLEWSWAEFSLVPIRSFFLQLQPTAACQLPTPTKSRGAPSQRLDDVIENGRLLCAVARSRYWPCLNCSDLFFSVPLQLPSSAKNLLVQNIQPNAQ